MPPRGLASAVLASAVLASGQNPAGAITQITGSPTVQASKFTTTGKQRDISIPFHKQCPVSDLKSKPTWEEIKKMDVRWKRYCLSTETVIFWFVYCLCNVMSSTARPRQHSLVEHITNRHLISSLSRNSSANCLGCRALCIGLSFRWRAELLVFRFLGDFLWRGPKNGVRGSTRNLRHKCNSSTGWSETWRYGWNRRIK